MCLTIACAGPCFAGPTALGEVPATSEPSDNAAFLPNDGASAAAGPATVRTRRTNDLSDSGNGSTALERSDNLYTTRGSDLSAPPAMPGLGGEARAVRAQPAQSREAESALKGIASSALGWVHDVLPWSTKESEVVVPQMAKVPVENVVLPIEVESGGLATLRAEAAGATPGSADATAHGGALTTATFGNTDRPRSADAGGESSGRQLIKLAREVVTHPLTWLVVILIAIAQVVVSRAGRGK